ncbi:tape measure protein [Lederbergia sp. NSJ-179]|uniref:tape measure protein n=1 Tax=Lederbergia sp. NSJ-179 TaxID=2931402 RepID=UPI001FD0D11B|nr:tape measure protein [Lederbergia sp. NSJ-179]MCJ7840503.1 tape measure protein [Lederbergia sp. NSJ-179]
MADKEKNVVLNFKMDGQVEYAKTIRDINAIMNAAASEYKTHIAAMGQDASATQKLAAEKKKLEIQLEAGKKRTEQLRTEYDAMAKSSKTTTGQLAAKHNQLMKSERAELALEKALEQVNEGLSDQAEESRKAEQAMNLLESQAERLDSQTQLLNAEYELQKEKLGDSADESEKLALKMAHLNDIHDVAKDKVENYEEQLELAKQQYGENSVEAERYEIQLLEAQAAEQRLANEIASTSKELDQQVSKLAKTSKSLQDLGKRLKDVGSDMSDIGKDLSLKVTAPVVGLAGALVKTGVEYKAFKEEAKQAFTVLLGSAEAAEEHMDRIMAFAKTTPFAFPDLVSANRKLVSFGMEAEKTEPVMEAIANAVAAMGGGAQEIGTLADVFAKIQSGGKITGEELNRFSDQGVNALAILANQAGVSMDEMRKKISAGAIDSETAIAGLVDGIMNGTEGVAGETAKLGGSLDALSGTWKGALDSMKGAWRRAGDAIVSDDMFSKMTESVGKLTEIINKLPEILGPVADTLGTMLIGLIDNLSVLADWFLNLDPVFQQMVVKLGLVAVAAGPLLLVLGKTITVVGSVISTVGTLIGWFGKLIPIIKVVGVFIGGISAPVWGVIAAIAALIAIGVLVWKKWEPIKAFFMNLWDDIKVVWSNFVEWSKEIFNSFIDFMKEWGLVILGAILGPITLAAALIFKYWEPIKAFFTETIPQAFNDLVAYMQELPGRVMEFLTKLFVEDIPSAIGFGIGWMVTKISEGITNTIQFFQELPGKVLVFLIETISNITTWATNMKERAIQTGTEFLINVIKFIQQLPGKIASFLTNIISNVSGWASNMKSKATEAGSNFINNVINFIKGLPGKIAKFLIETISKVIKFASDMKDKAKEAGKNAYDSIVDEIKKIPGKLVELGGDIISGLIKGVTGSISKVASLAKDVASSFIGGFRKAMDMHSPSRIMFKDGQFVMKGLGLGVEDQEDYVVNKAVNVARSITNTMRDGIELPDMEIGTLVRQPSNFGTYGNNYNTSSTEYNYHTVDMQGMFDGAVFNVRDDQDIPKLAKQLNDYIKMDARRNGVVMP